MVSESGEGEEEVIEVVEPNTKAKAGKGGKGKQGKGKGKDGASVSRLLPTPMQPISSMISNMASL